MIVLERIDNMKPTPKMFFLDALDRRWREYLDQVKNCRQETSNEAIHEYRVSTRRLLSIVDFLRGLNPCSDLIKLRSSLKTQLDDLDGLSDVQLMQVDVAELMGENPEVKPFLDHLYQQERSLSEKASHQINRMDVKSLGKRIQNVRASQKDFFSSSPTSKRDYLAIVDEAFDFVLDRYTLLDLVDTNTIHRLRIAFRKFRYQVEIVHPLIPSFPKTNMAAMREYQGSMGVIQDLEVLHKALLGFAYQSKGKSMDSVLSILLQQHSDAVEAFWKEKEGIHDFWRSSSKAKYSWNEKKKTAVPSDSQ
jgi:CHAD domain-containing protein